MPNFKFNIFGRGWYFRQQHLIGLDGWSDVNNFVIYKGGIEKVRGWKSIKLVPHTSVINDFTSGVIDDYLEIIDTFDAS